MRFFLNLLKIIFKGFPNVFDIRTSLKFLLIPSTFLFKNFRNFFFYTFFRSFRRLHRKSFKIFLKFFHIFRKLFHVKIFKKVFQNRSKIFLNLARNFLKISLITLHSFFEIYRSSPFFKILQQFSYNQWRTQGGARGAIAPLDSVAP